MKKFSKIVEGKLNQDDLISKLGISNDDLDEVFIDMVDLGYDMTKEDVYISSKTGYPHRSSSSSKEFYPGLEINLHRKTSDSDGNHLKQFDDVRKWNGGVYYEDDILIIESVANTVHRLKSMLDNKAKVYYSIRTLNEILIRIMFEKDKNSESIDFEKVKEYIDDLQSRSTQYSTYSTLDGDRIDYYKVVRSWSSSNNYGTQIKPLTSSRSSRVNINTPVDSADFIIKDIIDKGKSDNKYQLDSILDIYVNKLYKEANSLNKLELVKVKDGPLVIQYNIIDKESKSKLIDISANYETFADEVNVIVGKGGLFSRDIIKTVSIYYMEIKIKLIIED